MKNNIRQIRIDKNLTQEDVAKMIGDHMGIKVSQQQIQRLENQDIIKSDYLEAYSRVFGVPTDYILGLIEKPTVNNSIADISHQIGLSQQGVESLIRIKNKITTTENYLATDGLDMRKGTLDYLLCNYEGIFAEILSNSFYMLRDAILFRNNIEVKEKIHPWGKALQNATDEHREKSDFRLYKIQCLFRDIQNDVINGDSQEKRDDFPNRCGINRYWDKISKADKQQKKTAIEENNGSL